jgi:hypothetical protein
MATDRTAQVTWQGSLLEGGGTIDSVEAARSARSRSPGRLAPKSPPGARAPRS